ncbi:MAG: hypothetical protein WCR52_22665 [Bacteroidota bacterium]
MKNFLIFCLALFTLPTVSFGQWTNNGTTTTSLFTNEAVRTGNTGVGFTDGTSYITTAGTSGAKFLVQGGILGHYVSGTVGDFAGKWCGLGIGNPGGPSTSPKPYGLAIIDTNNVAFYNIITRNLRRNYSQKYRCGIRR